MKDKVYVYVVDTRKKGEEFKRWPDAVEATSILEVGRMLGVKQENLRYVSKTPRR